MVLIRRFLTMSPITIAAVKEQAGEIPIHAAIHAQLQSRRARTTALRPDFRKVSEILEELDRLILRFRRTESGTRFAEA